jgi:hypothetical protein
MKISIMSNAQITVSTERIVESRCREFLQSQGMRSLPTPLLMRTWEIHDCLLVPIGHSIRKCNERINCDLQIEINPLIEEGITDLYWKLYGERNDSINLMTSEKVGTSTAFLMKAIREQDNLDGGIYCIASPYRQKIASAILEVEVAFYCYSIQEACNFYANLISYVTKQPLKLEMYPTYFSWASFAIKFSDASNSYNQRFGAAGFLRDELYGLFRCSDIKKKRGNIVFLGVSVSGLASILQKN